MVVFNFIAPGNRCDFLFSCQKSKPVRLPKLIGWRFGKAFPDRAEPHLFVVGCVGIGQTSVLFEKARHII